MKANLIVMTLLVAATLACAEGQPQTTCPVMKGSPVNKSLYVDAEGYRIYVCCRGCLGAIEAAPAKYIAQLQAEGVELEKAPAE